MRCIGSSSGELLASFLLLVLVILIDPSSASLLLPAPLRSTAFAVRSRRHFDRVAPLHPLHPLRTKQKRQLDSNNNDNEDEGRHIPSSLELPIVFRSKDRKNNENSTTTMTTSDLTETLPATTTAMPLVLLDDNLIDQALSSNVSYFYLQKELGLSEESMWKITIEAPSALGMTAATIRSKVEVLRDAMDLSPDDIRDILSRQPTLLHLSATNNLKPKLEWIQTSLEMSNKKNQLRQLIMSQPSILTYSPTNLQNKFRFFTTTKGLGFTPTETRQLLLREPKLWTASVQSGLLPRARFFLHELEIPKHKLRAIVTKNPRLLLYSLETNLTPKLINYCIMTLHMEPATHLLKLLSTYPEFFDSNWERKILPITRYFLSELDFSAHEFRSIILKFPRLTTNSIRKIKHNVGYLRYGLQLDASGVRRVLYQAPQVLSLDEKTNLAPKIEFLKQQLLVVGATTNTTTTNNNNSLITDAKNEGDEEPKKDEDEVARHVIKSCILGLPTILYLSVEKNLAPKIEYLRSMLRLEVRNSFSSGSSTEDPQQPQTQGATSNSDEEEEEESILQRLLCQTVLKKPALLGYSLEKRIKPRLERIVNAGLPPSSITIGISMTDEKFQSWLHGRQKKKARMAITVWQEQSSISPSSSSQKAARTTTMSSLSSSSIPSTTNLEGEENSQLNGEETDRSSRIVHWTRERKPL